MDKIAREQQLIDRAVVLALWLLKNSAPAQAHALLTEPRRAAAETSDFEARLARDQCNDAERLEYVCADLANPGADFHKRREVFPTEALVVTTFEIAVPTDFLRNLVHQANRGPEMVPNPPQVEDAHEIHRKKAGSAHTCLHGDGMHLLHPRVPVDEANPRAIDFPAEVPGVARMIPTPEAQPSCGTTRFPSYCATRAEAATADHPMRRAVIEIPRRNAERDVQGAQPFAPRQTPVSGRVRWDLPGS